MTSSLSDNATLELHFGSLSDVDYSLTCHTLCSPDFPSCSSYTLTVATPNDTVVLDDLTVHRERARQITESFYLEAVLPENAPYIAEDLLADENFVC